MNKKVIKKWVKALRSGKYKQGIGKLRDAYNNFCCLGVLTDLYCKRTNKKWIREGNKYLFDEMAFTLPNEVIEWAKTNYVIEQELINMNDGGKTFNQIANYIEENCL